MTDLNENWYEHSKTDPHYTFYLRTLGKGNVTDARIYEVGMTLSALAFVMK
jgi:hypothetical protein